MSTILPLAYLPSVEYFTHLLRGGCVVDLGEHFVKRSERNRARILASDGVMELTVHVRNANRPRQPVRDVRLDYSKRWQHQHWGALVASYRSSPYFDFYAGRFEPFYRREWEFLADYNLGLLEVVFAGRSADARTLPDVCRGGPRRPRPAPQTQRRPGADRRALFPGLLRKDAFRP